MSRDKLTRDARTMIELQVDCVLNVSSCDMQKGIAYGMIDMAYKLGYIDSQLKAYYMEKISIH